jgi:hypothetical protein
VDGDGGAAAGEAVDLAGVAQFFSGGGGGRGLLKFAKTGTGVGEAPGGEFDAEAIEGLVDFSILSVCGLGVPPRCEV